jgi:hypothetical protein
VAQRRSNIDHHCAVIGDILLDDASLKRERIGEVLRRSSMK